MIETKNFVARIEQLQSNIWSNHIKVPNEVASYYKEQNVKRLLCHINGQLTIHCAILFNKEGPYILLNKPLVKKLQSSSQGVLQISLEVDHSKYGMKMPEEFLASLKEDPSAYEHFENLTAGKQRNLIHLVASVKSSEIKIRRSLAILDHLNRESGQLDFKKLNALIKEYNQKFNIN